jgi:hypothetical protein
MLPLHAGAFWNVAAAAGLQPYQAGKVLAPPVVAAVDSGAVCTVAAVQRLLFADRLQPLLVWLLEAMVRDLERVDAAAAAAWEVLRAPGVLGAGERLHSHHVLNIKACLTGSTTTLHALPACTHWHAELVGDVSALLCIDGHHYTAAALAQALCDFEGGGQHQAGGLHIDGGCCWHSLVAGVVHAGCMQGAYASGMRLCALACDLCA